MIDRGLVISVPNGGGCSHSQTQPEQIFLIRNNSTLCYFFVQTKKGKHIALKKFSFFPLKINAYDGPGTHYLLLLPERYVYKCSTHQCTVHVLHSINKYTMSLNFSSMDIKSKLVYLDTDSDISLPNVNCMSKTCIFDVRYNAGYQVNMTLISIKFQGPDSEVCKYGGLTAIESLKHEYKQHVPLCTNYSSKTWSQRGFYSVNSSLKVVLYWYQPYSTIDVTFSISGTKCDTVQISPSTYCSECSFNSPCLSYFNRVTQYSNVSLKTNDIDTILYSISDNQCFVLQLIENSTTPKISTSCNMDIAPDIIPEMKSRIHYFITGSMEPFFSQYQMNKTIHTKLRTIARYYSSNQTYDYIAFYGIVDMFCIPFYGPSISYCVKNPSVSASSLETFYAKVTQLYFPMNILAFGSFETPAHVHSLKISVGLFMLANSWVEMKFYRHHIPDNVPKIRYDKFLFLDHYNEVKEISRRREIVMLLTVETEVTDRQWLYELQAKIKLDSSDDIQMRWQSTVTFTKWKKSNYISLPGTILNVQLEEAKKMAGTVLKVAWINDIYKLFFPLLSHKNKKVCQSSVTKASGPIAFDQYIRMD